MSNLFFHARFLAGLFCVFCFLAGCARDIPAFTPPAQRPVQAREKPWPVNHFVVLAYHDIEDSDPDQAFVSVRTDHLAQQFAWLRANGYQPVSIDQILAARRGVKPLPEKAVLLSFDDGYSSFYTRVFPLIKAYGWPCVLAPVGAWVDAPADQPNVDFGGLLVPRERFLTWEQVKEVSRSGLVEVGAHTDALHYGAPANPQGNLEPAAAAHIFDAATGRYETQAEFEARIQRDVSRISEKIRRVTGKSPRVWVWPYGAASGTALKIIGRNGYQMALTLEDGPATLENLMSTPRMLVSNDPDLRNFANAVLNISAPPIQRVAQVDLDYVYDPDPAQMDRNLGLLVQRIADMQITTVFLQAFADPEGDGLVKSVYFPNRILPMRADLFNRAAWQLRNRAHVEIYAWMPVLSFDLAPSIARVTRPDPGGAGNIVDAGQYRRLSPFDPEARRQIIELYEDLSRQAIFDGILYHDDALLSDFEDAGPRAQEAYRAAGLPATVAALRADPAAMQRWTRFKSRYLVDFTTDITRHVRAIRGPQIKTARNIFASPILEPASEAWFAQNLDDFLSAYDWTVPMAMPLMENIPADRADAWLERLVDAVGTRPGALDRTIFELQSRDWRDAPAAGGDGHVASSLLAHWMKLLPQRGARNFGYYPDDFLQNQPRLETIRPAISSAWYPFDD